MEEVGHNGCVECIWVLVVGLWAQVTLIHCSLVILNFRGVLNNHQLAPFNFIYY
jgi:hypothetical protein